jgi:hypothetical protein
LFVQNGPEDKISPGERQLGFCIADDLVEHTKQASAGLVPFFIPAMLQGVLSEYGGIRQAAAYGLGVMAEQCPEQFAPHVHGTSTN